MTVHVTVRPEVGTDVEDGGVVYAGFVDNVVGVKDVDAFKSGTRNVRLEG